MGNSLRCCLACAIPCGALDVVRIVHINGQVEQFSRHVAAGEILASNPGHVLSAAYSSARRLTVMSPESELKRGNIYFLIPSDSKREKRKKKKEAAFCNYSEEIGANDDISSEKCSVDQRRHRGGSQAATWQPQLERIFED